MRKLYSLLIAGATLASITSNMPAQADDEMWFNPFTEADPYYSQQPEEAPAPPPAKPAEPVPPPKPTSIIESAIPMTNRITEMPQMRILGLWVGNMKYKVGQADGRLYLVDTDGSLKLLPSKTDADSITVPSDSPVLSQLEPNQQKKNFTPDPNGPKFVIGQTGLLKPKVIGTRTAMVNGKPVVMAGVIISEYTPSSPPSANQWNSSNFGATSMAPVSAQAQAEALYRYRALEQPNFLPPTNHIQHTAARVYSGAEQASVDPVKVVQGKSKQKRANGHT